MKQLFRNILLFGIATAMFTACGDDPEVTKKDENPNGTSSNGALTKGAFTIAQGKQVYFSQGNLQYQASTNTWRFAENQWDIIGEANENISETYDGWIDLFGWGTSGYNGKNPYMTSENYEDYGDGENDIAGTNYDWGVYNKISNGGNKAGMWRTLTEEEWDYLIDRRPHCNDLYSRGCVDGIDGLILLPDDWVLPDGSSFTPYGEEYKTNDYTIKEWVKMETNGAVFLPAAGERYWTGVDFYIFGSLGYYWSSSAFGSCDAGYLEFNSSYYVSTDSRYRDNGFSVRLVRGL